MQKESGIKEYYELSDTTNRLEEADNIVFELSNDITFTTENIVNHQIQKSNSSIEMYQDAVNDQLGLVVAELESVNFDNYVEASEIEEKMNLEINSILAEIFN